MQSALIDLMEVLLFVLTRGVLGAHLFLCVVGRAEMI